MGKLESSKTMWENEESMEKNIGKLEENWYFMKKTKENWEFIGKSNRKIRKFIGKKTRGKLGDNGEFMGFMADSWLSW